MKASLLLSFTISTLRPSLSRISLEGDFFAFFAEPLSDGLCGLSMGDCVLSSCFSVNTERLASGVQPSATDASFSGPSLARISLNVVTRFAYTLTSTLEANKNGVWMNIRGFKRGFTLRTLRFSLQQRLQAFPMGDAVQL